MNVVAFTISQKSFLHNIIPYVFHKYYITILIFYAANIFHPNLKTKFNCC